MWKFLHRWLGIPFWRQPDPGRPSSPHATRKRVWTGAGSGTEQAILLHLSRGPMTRAELNAVLDVTTSGLILPRMVERGVIRVLPNTWPYCYELVDTEKESVQELEKASCAE